MSMENKEGFIWMDGKMLPWQDAKVHVLTHSLHYGMGAFEGVRAYNTAKGTAIFRLVEHTDRLFESAHILKMKIPYTKDAVLQAQIDVIKANKLKSAYIRPLIFYGAEGMGLRADNLKVHLTIAAWEWGAYLGSTSLEKGIRVGTSSFARHSVNSMMCKAKANGGYINSMLALQEALACGYDEALLLDAQGFVAEGSGENIFIVKKGVLMTPDTAILEGITRDTIIQIAKKAGIPVVERRITRDEVAIADEAFFTGTAAEVTPIREIDGRMIGTGAKGEITQYLQTTFFKIVKGEDPSFQEWLTIV